MANRLDCTAAQRKDYSRQRLPAEKAARGDHSAKINTLPRAPNPLAPRPNSRPATIIPKDQWTQAQRDIYSRITDQIAAQRAGRATPASKTIAQHASDKFKAETLKAAKKAGPNAVLHWDGSNSATCFESGSYDRKRSTLNLVFQKRDSGAGFDFDCDLETAISIFMDASPGGVYNAIF